MLESPLLPCFWRVPTDNDEGRNNSYASSWRKVGLDDYKIKTKQLDFVILPTGDVQVYVNNLLEFKEGNILQKANYTISHEGEVLIDAIFYINIDVLSLPRVGMKCALPVEWKISLGLEEALTKAMMIEKNQLMLVFIMELSVNSLFHILCLKKMEIKRITAGWRYMMISEAEYV